MTSSCGSAEEMLHSIVKGRMSSPLLRSKTRLVLTARRQVGIVQSNFSSRFKTGNTKRVVIDAG